MTRSNGSSAGSPVVSNAISMPLAGAMGTGAILVDGSTTVNNVLRFTLSLRGVPMEWMTPEDAAWLHMEDRNNHMHGCTTVVFEGPAPTFAEVVGLIESKLPVVPRFRQKVRDVPFHLGRPAWVDDEHFNLSYHVRRTALPAPGGDEELKKLKSRIQSQMMDRTKPLWEWWLVEGLSDGHWAIMHKTHHCIVDGVGNIDLLSVVFDKSPDAPRPPAPEPWTPAPEPSDADLLRAALRERIVSPYEQWRGVVAATRAPRRTAARAAEILRGTGAMTRLASRASPSLNGPIGPHRRWTWARTSMDDVKTVRKALGGTVNDVVLANVTRGFRDLLISRGEDVDGRVVRTMVPVSVRAAGDPEAEGNRISAVFADLPVGIKDAADRLAAVRAQMDGLKESKQAVAAEALSSLSGYAPPMLVAQAVRCSSGSPWTPSTRW